jgi:hypothetical protein
MKSALTFIACLLFSNLALGNQMKEVPGKSISLESLESMFNNIQKETEWDISKDLLWGYFFTHSEPKKLEEASLILESRGYKVVDIYLSDKDDKNEPDLFWLHVSKVEIHTPKTLDEQNNEFYIFAHDFGLDSYDGMDVGPIGK